MRLRAPLAMSAVLTTLLSVPAAPAQAATEGYVALGDSYASGLGSRSYYRDGTSCHRSPQAYGSLVAASYGLSLTLAACSGASTTDVLNKQVTSLGSGTAYVTLTVGGNDLGFSSVLTECALPGWMSDCNGAIDGGLRVLSNNLPGRLTTLLATVHDRAPRAQVLLTGYPHLFHDEDCSAATFFSRREERRLNDTTDQLNRLLESRSAAAGVAYVSPVASFTGHAWCDDGAWINGLSHPIVNSFHPKVRGHAAYAQLVGPALVGSQPALSLAAVQRLPRPGTSVRLPRDTTPARSFGFGLPNLGSARAIRAATSAGITRAELTRLQVAQRRGASNATLERLNRQITQAAKLRSR